jgi:hypothetical protein
MNAPSKTKSYLAAAVIFFLLVLVAVIFVSRIRGRQNDALTLLEILRTQTVGQSDLQSFDANTRQFKRYAVVSMNDPSVRRFIISSAVGRSYFAISAHFEKGILDGRSAGLAAQGCCTLNIEESDMKAKAGFFKEEPYSIRRKGQKDLQVDVSPMKKSLTDKLLLGFNVKCLSFPSICSSENDLNFELRTIQ